MLRNLPISLFFTFFISRHCFICEGSKSSARLSSDVSSWNFVVMSNSPEAEARVPFSPSNVWQRASFSFAEAVPMLCSASRCAFSKDSH